MLADLESIDQIQKKVHRLLNSDNGGDNDGGDIFK